MTMKYAVSLFVFFLFASFTLAAPPERTERPLSDYEVLHRATEFSVGPVGFAGTTSSTESAFRKVLRTSAAARDFHGLLSDATTAGKLYGLLGLKLLKDPEYATVASRFKVSRAQVSVTSGCITASRPVAEIAKHIDKGDLK